MDAVTERQAGHHIDAHDGRDAAVGKVTANTIADALAVMLADLVAVLSDAPTVETLERLANRLDDRGRIANGTPAAALLGQVSVSLMRMGL
ncbi:hypothetical protein [Methylobacterium sp. E-045]|uniref:hypothetical protein n=1 Tax=Methylobacterium sp. E-045 TaxID=2836575 RepID=UPI001FBB9125|nr:hypothetical protein [Methylobacterium sp. E-045]MCJ2127992.1 hypothetical protein [Methylobacterium sp. E-045]